MRATLAALLLGVVICGCSSGGKRVVVYVSVDQTHAEPILEAFEKKTGIQVAPVYDVEASKATGLANRLIAESGDRKSVV